MNASTYTPRVPHHIAADAAADAAQAAQNELEAQHRRNWHDHSCSCGRVFKTGQGLGLHRGAVARQADKLWDDTYNAAMDRAGY